jgi:hypothetical protein
MGILEKLLLAWGVVTTVLICALIYRSTLETREDDQLFLDSQDITRSEQRVIVGRIEKLSRPIVALWVVSGALLVAVAGMWLWQGYQSF